MAHFAGRRETGVKFPMGAASVDPKNTQHIPLTIFSTDKTTPYYAVRALVEQMIERRGAETILCHRLLCEYRGSN